MAHRALIIRRYTGNACPCVVHSSPDLKNGNWLHQVMTIRTRLTLWYSALLATVILVFGVSLFSLLNWAWYSQLRENMDYVAERMLRLISVDPISGDLNPPSLDNEAAQMPFFAFGIQVWRRDGLLVAVSENAKTMQTPFDAPMLGNASMITRDVRLADGTHVLVATVAHSVGTK